MAGPPSLLKAHPVWPGYLLQPRRGNIRNGPARSRRPSDLRKWSYVEGLIDPQGIWVLISRPCKHSP